MSCFNLSLTQITNALNIKIGTIFFLQKKKIDYLLPFSLTNAVAQWVRALTPQAKG